MSFYGRNDTTNLAANAAEEERRRINEQEASGRHARSWDLAAARGKKDQGTGPIARLVSRIRRAIGR